MFCKKRIPLTHSFPIGYKWANIRRKTGKSKIVIRDDQGTIVLKFVFLKSHKRSCSVRKGVRRDFAKYTEKHLCQSLFLNKVSALKPATLLKKRLWYRYFPGNFAKFLRTPFLQSTSVRLLLIVIIDTRKYSISCFHLGNLFYYRSSLWT